MTNHWLLVGSDILSVVKWVMPLAGSILLVMCQGDERAIVVGSVIYIMGVCLLAGVL